MLVGLGSIFKHEVQKSVSVSVAVKMELCAPFCAQQKLSLRQSYNQVDIHSGNLTWQWTFPFSNRKFILQMVDFTFCMLEYRRVNGIEVIGSSILVPVSPWSSVHRLVARSTLPTHVVQYLHTSCNRYGLDIHVREYLFVYDHGYFCSKHK